MLKILFSDKDDWKMKSEGRYDKAIYDFNYANFNTLKSLDPYDMVIPLYEKDIHTSLAKGTYFLHMQSSGTYSVSKFIVE